VIGLLRTLARHAFRKGTQGGERAWLALAILSWFVARTREKSKEEPPALYREMLGPGESITIRIFEPPR
jgi:hypothetical protein